MKKGNFLTRLTINDLNKILSTLKKKEEKIPDQLENDIALTRDSEFLTISPNLEEYIVYYLSAYKHLCECVLREDEDA